MEWKDYNRDRIVREILNATYDKDQLNTLFGERIRLAKEMFNTGADHSVQIDLVNKRIKSLLAL